MTCTKTCVNTGDDPQGKNEQNTTRREHNPNDSNAWEIGYLEHMVSNRAIFLYKSRIRVIPPRLLFCVAIQLCDFCMAILQS